MQNFLKNFLEKASENDLEKKIDTFSKIVERNKIKNSGASIDDVVASAKEYNVKYKMYF